MDFKFLISFGVGLAIYFVCLGVFVLIKRYKNKKHFDKEVKDRERDNNNGQE